MWLRRLFLIAASITIFFSVVGSSCKNTTESDDINSTALAAPVYISPDNASNVIGPDVTIVFHSDTNDEGEMLFYQLAHGTNEPPNIYTTLGQETTYTFTGLNLNDTLYWKVQAYDPGISALWGTQWFFVVSELEIGGDPINPDPDSAATSIPISTDISWEYTGSPNDVIYCDVYFGSSEDPGLVSSNQTGTTYDPGRLEYETTYYWKIVSYISPIEYIEGPRWEFTTNAEDFEVPQNPNPADGALSVLAATNLSWEYSGTPADVIYCDVYLGTTSDPELVSDNQTGTTYDPPANLEYTTAYYWKIVAFTTPTDSIAGPVWTFNTETTVAQDIYALFKFTSDSYGEYFVVDNITARFDSAYAPDDAIIPIQADAVTVNGNAMYWGSFEGEYYYFEESSMPWLINGGTYTFEVTGNTKLPSLTLETTYLECAPVITYPASGNTIYSAGFTTQWEGTCEGNVVLTFILNGTDTADVWIVTENDGEYQFTADDLSPLGGYTGVISEVIIFEDRYYIEKTGYQALSEVIMRRTSTATTVME